MWSLYNFIFVLFSYEPLLTCGANLSIIGWLPYSAEMAISVGQAGFYTAIRLTNHCVSPNAIYSLLTIN